MLSVTRYSSDCSRNREHGSGLPTSNDEPNMGAASSEVASRARMKKIRSSVAGLGVMMGPFRRNAAQLSLVRRRDVGEQQQQQQQHQRDTAGRSGETQHSRRAANPSHWASSIRPYIKLAEMNRSTGAASPEPVGGAHSSCHVTRADCGRFLVTVSDW